MLRSLVPSSSAARSAGPGPLALVRGAEGCRALPLVSFLPCQGRLSGEGQQHCPVCPLPGWVSRDGTSQQQLLRALGGESWGESQAQASCAAAALRVALGCV